MRCCSSAAEPEVNQARLSNTSSKSIQAAAEARSPAHAPHLAWPRRDLPAPRVPSESGCESASQAPADGLAQNQAPGGSGNQQIAGSLQPAACPNLTGLKRESALVVEFGAKLGWISTAPERLARRRGATATTTVGQDDRSGGKQAERPRRDRPSRRPLLRTGRPELRRRLRRARSASCHRGPLSRACGPEALQRVGAAPWKPSARCARPCRCSDR